jgi:hypothetical protein
MEVTRNPYQSLVGKSQVKKPARRLEDYIKNSPKSTGRINGNICFKISLMACFLDDDDGFIAS